MNLFSARTFLLAMFATFFFAACEQQEEVAPNHTASAPVDNAQIKAQLNATMNALKGNDDYPLSLASYEFIGNVEEAAKLKESILQDDNIIPVYTNVSGEDLMTNNFTFELKTLTEAINTGNERQEGHGTFANPKESIGNYLDGVLEEGQGLVTLHWESNRGQFTSTAVYNANGLVYDNILANVFSVQEGEVDVKEEKDAARAQAIYRYTVVNFDLTWIWGADRGFVYIRHDVTKNGSTIAANGGYTDAFLNLGSAEAEAKDLPIQNNTAKLAWAYGYATPGASFSISFNYSTLTFETSVSGIGTKAANSGVDVRQ